MLESGESIAALRAARDAALQAAQIAVRDTTRLTRVFTILSDPAPLGEVLDRALAALSELFAADIVVLLDPARSGSYVPLAAIGLPEDVISDAFSGVEDSYTCQAMRSAAPVLVHDIDTDERVEAQLRDQGAITAIWLPVPSNRMARGVLILARCQRAPFEHADVGMLASMTYRIGLLLDLAQHSEQLEAVVNFGRAIHNDLDEISICTHAVVKFPGVFGTNSAAVFLIDDGEQIDCIAETGFSRAFSSHWAVIAKILVLQDRIDGVVIYHEDDLQEKMSRGGVSFGPTHAPVSLLAAPLLFQGRLQGVLLGGRFSDVAIHPDTLQTIALFAGQTAAAIENARLYRSVRDELAERRHAERALKASDDRFRALVHSVTDVIVILSTDGRILYASPAARDAWGMSPEDLKDTAILDLAHPAYVDQGKHEFVALLGAPNATTTLKVRMRHTESDWRDFEVILTNLVDDYAVGGIVGTFHDVTEREIYEKELKQMAFCDPLTGLYNRSYFTECVARALEHGDEFSEPVAVIFLDLDNFKTVNDRLGHAVGDEALRVIAGRIQSCLRRDDVAARMGGDEFTIMINDFSEPGQVNAIAQRLLDALKEPIMLKDCQIALSGSLGIAVGSSNRESADHLIQRADQAMYRVKSSGKGSFVVL